VVNKRELQKAETRAAILRAAAAEFAVRGYAGTSISDVAAAMGRPKSAVGYHHFSSKAQLAAAVVEEQWQCWSAIRAEVEASVPAGVPRLLSLLLASAANGRESAVARASVRLLAERVLSGLEVPERPFGWRDYATEQIQISIDNGDLTTDQSAASIAARLLSASLGVFEAESRGLQPVDTENALRALWVDLFAGIDRDGGARLVTPVDISSISRSGEHGSVGRRHENDGPAD
jgi:AcrR family transcriptional regulator